MPAFAVKSKTSNGSNLTAAAQKQNALLTLAGGPLSEYVPIRFAIAANSRNPPLSTGPITALFALISPETWRPTDPIMARMIAPDLNNLPVHQE